MKTLTEFCSKNSIQNGEISGIGAVKNIEIGAFDPGSKSYIHKKFDKTHELISCMGNITLKDGEPFIHSHITIGDHDMNVKGGHVFEMTVAVVGEFYIRKIDGSIHRELNGDIGLAVCCVEE
jgi:predicted DNA-binding protein with PD1-like motif